MNVGRRNLTAVLAVTGVLAATIVLIWVLAPSGDDDDPPSTTTTLTDEQQRQKKIASAWVQDARDAFADLGGAIPNLVRRTDEWLAGKVTDEDLAADLDTWAGLARSAREAAGELDDIELAPESDRLLELTADLYIEVVNVHDAALDVDDAELRTQVHLLARRVRTLADRVYDRGYELVKPFLFVEQAPDVTVNLPEEVPIWPELNLEPGPPLGPRPAPAAESPALRQENRPEQPREEWIGALRLVNPTSAGDLAAAIDGGSGEDLRATAERLIAAAEALRAEPDPEDNREESARVRLGLLIHADAARTAQAGTLVANPGRGDALRSIARRLAVIGGDPVLWVSELAARDPGYDPGELGPP